MHFYFSVYKNSKYKGIKRRDYSRFVSGKDTGGISGWQNGQVEYSVALNSSITGTNSVNRVVLNGITDRIVNCYGSSEIAGTWNYKELNARDGKDVDKVDYETETWWKTTSNLGWDFTTIWEWDNDIKRPVLR